MSSSVCVPTRSCPPLREERTTVNRATLTPLRGACRSLFGPIDHDELRGELKRQLREIQARDCQRWNFDFQAGRPLGGNYTWELQEGRDVPSFYRELPTEESRKENGESHVPNQSPVGVKKDSCARVTVAKRKASNSIITDFFPKKKRSQGLKVPGESCGVPHPLLNMEQTPRKKIR